MAECSYCGTATDPDDRFCPRCGERQSDRGPRDGFLDPEVVQYLDGVRNGARALDPESDLHRRLQTQLSAAVADFGHLAGVGLDFRETLDLTTASALEPTDPVAESDATARQVLGLAVLLGHLSEAFPETGVDELLAYAHEVDEEY